MRDAQGRVQPPNADWSDVAKLDYANPKTRAYMIEMMAHWLRDYGVDGFRCDVAGLVPTDFWEEARPKLEAIRPDLFLLAEWSTPDSHGEGLRRRLRAGPSTRRSTGSCPSAPPPPASAPPGRRSRRNFPKGSLHLRFSDNHDEKRAIARFGEPAALAAQALVFTMDGIPLVYNGMEVGDTAESGGPALTERVPLFWPIVERRPEFQTFYRSMIALRREHPALRLGETLWLDSSGPDRVVSFVRRGGGEEVLVAVNLSSQPFAGTVQAPAGAPFVEITPAVPLPQQPGGASPPRAVHAGELPTLALDAWGYRLFRRVAP